MSTLSVTGDELINIEFVLLFLFFCDKYLGFFLREINDIDIQILDILVNKQMWSYVRNLKYYLGVVFEIIQVIIQAVSQYIFSITEKTIRNEIVLITGSGRGLGKINLIYSCD
jgi:hypothetical protein